MGSRTLRAAVAAALLGACAKAPAPIVEESTQPPAGETATVVVSVTGAGTVGFDGQPPCSSACRYSVPRHASVRLVALPESGTTSPVGRVRAPGPASASSSPSAMRRWRRNSHRPG